MDTAWVRIRSDKFINQIHTFGFDLFISLLKTLRKVIGKKIEIGFFHIVRLAIVPN